MKYHKHFVKSYGFDLREHSLDNEMLQNILSIQLIVWCEQPPQTNNPDLVSINSTISSLTGASVILCSGLLSHGNSLGVSSTITVLIALPILFA
jgi:hypothetical protein